MYCTLIYASMRLSKYYLFNLLQFIKIYIPCHCLSYINVNIFPVITYPRYPKIEQSPFVRCKCSVTLTCLLRSIKVTSTAMCKRILGVCRLGVAFVYWYARVAAKRSPEHQTNKFCILAVSCKTNASQSEFTVTREVFCTFYDFLHVIH